MLEIHKNRTEQARMDFVSGLMGYNSTGIGAAMATYYQNKTKKHKHTPEMQEVKEIMEKSPIYKFGAFFERHNHALMFQTTLDILESRKEEVMSWLDSYEENNALGSLKLNPDLGIPSYYDKIEIHTQPGNYHGPYGGFLYHWMIGPFLVERDENDEMGWDLANGIPKGDYKKILDLGCGIGKSTFPYCDLYPEAEVYGLDYAAPMIKYGHKLAESRNKKVHFVQNFAEETGFEDNSFDLVTALWLFHEIPKPAMRKVVKEAYRILKPGGTFAIMESPPYKMMNKNYNPLSEFLLNSTAIRMHDPSIMTLMKLHRPDLLSEGGFKETRDVALPNHLTGYDNEGSYFFGAFPWWMTIGSK